MKSIINAAPGLVNLGLKDETVQRGARVAETYPQHLSKFFLWAERGPCTRDPNCEQLLVGNERNTMYGASTFDESSKYFNHQTMFANLANASANAGMYVRLIPNDAGPRATIRMYLDVLETEVDDYDRNSDGSIKMDMGGSPIILGKVQGFSVKWVFKYAVDHDDAELFGELTQLPGTQIHPVSGQPSTLYPIFEKEVSSYGEAGNLSGIRLWAQNSLNTSLPTKMIAKERAYPFSMSVIRKNTSTGNAVVQETIFDEQSVTVVFKENVRDPQTNSVLYIGERAVNDWQNLEDQRYPKVYGDFGRFALYQDNLEELLAKFQAAEAPFMGPNGDFTDDEADMYMFNFISGRTLDNVPYHTFVFADAADSVRFTKDTNIYAKGASDGTMNDETFAALVEEYMERYADPDDELMDVPYHVESHVYDSGFPLSTKKKLLNMIAERKDTFAVLGVYESGSRKLTAGEEYSVAQTLKTVAQTFPESPYFGTPAYRALIMGGSGKIRNSSIKKHFPLTYEVLRMSADYMGNGNGAYRAGQGFSPEGYPGSEITQMYDLSLPYISDNVKVRNWDVGLNWVARYDRKQFVIPALKTIYTEDTSVATGYINSCILAYLNKVLAKAHLTFSGRSDLTPAQFTERVNNFIVAETLGKFDGRAIITPKAHFTSLDEARNYSWTVPLECELNGMKTVMTGYVVARRRSDTN